MGRRLGCLFSLVVGSRNMHLHVCRTSMAKLAFLASVPSRIAHNLAHPLTSHFRLVCERCAQRLYHLNRSYVIWSYLQMMRRTMMLCVVVRSV